MLFSVFTQSCMATHNSNTVIKLLKTPPSSTALQMETSLPTKQRFRALTWCQENNLMFNVSKTKGPVDRELKSGAGDPRGTA